MTTFHHDHYRVVNAPSCCVTCVRHDGGFSAQSMYEKLTLYVVLGESVGTGTAENGILPLKPVGIA
jgi:hypothetical protein